MARSSLLFTIGHKPDCRNIASELLATDSKPIAAVVPWLQLCCNSERKEKSANIFE